VTTTKGRGSSRKLVQIGTVEVNSGTVCIWDSCRVPVPRRAKPSTSAAAG
jgi:hypothetical protein